MHIFTRFSLWGILYSLYSLIYFNAQGITSKLAQLKTLISDENPDIICISETWCNKDILDSELVVPNYVVFRRDRNIDHFIPGTFTATARGGGGGVES